MERVVLEPGVLLSTLITLQGTPAKLWQAVFDERLEVAGVSPAPGRKLAGVRERPKFRPYVTPEEAQSFVAEARPAGPPRARPLGRAPSQP